MPPTGTNGLAQRRGGEFSPTSLAEREPHLFIRCGAPEVSSFSLKQAYGPNLSALRAYKAFQMNSEKVKSLHGIIISST